MKLNKAKIPKNLNLWFMYCVWLSQAQKQKKKRYNSSQLYELVQQKL